MITPEDLLAQDSIYGWEVEKGDILDGLTSLLLNAGFLPKEDSSKTDEQRRKSLLIGEYDFVREGVEVKYQHNGGKTQVFLRNYQNGNPNDLPKLHQIGLQYHKIQQYLVNVESQPWLAFATEC